MDRREFLKVGTMVGLTLASGHASAITPPAEGGSFVEVMVPPARLAAPAALAARRNLLGIATPAAVSSGRWVLAGAAAPAEAPGCVQDGNDRLARLCGCRPRLPALAALPVQPTAAAHELARCVARGMAGGTLAVEGDGLAERLRTLDPVFAAARALRVPLALVPAGHPPYGWASAVTEALVTIGVLEAFDGLTVVVAKVDDELPWSLARIDQRLADQCKGQPPLQQIRAGIYYATNGLNYHPALLDLAGLVGAERLLYASDGTFSYDPAAVYRAARLPGAELECIMRDNAVRLFALG